MEGITATHKCCKFQMKSCRKARKACRNGWKSRKSKKRRKKNKKPDTAELRNVKSRWNDGIVVCGLMAERWRGKLKTQRTYAFYNFWTEFIRMLTMEKFTYFTRFSSPTFVSSSSSFSSVFLLWLVHFVSIPAPYGIRFQIFAIFFFIFIDWIASIHHNSQRNEYVLSVTKERPTKIF